MSVEYCNTCKMFHPGEECEQAIARQSNPAIRAKNRGKFHPFCNVCKTWHKAGKHEFNAAQFDADLAESDE